MYFVKLNSLIFYCNECNLTCKFWYLVLLEFGNFQNLMTKVTYITIENPAVCVMKVSKISLGKRFCHFDTVFVDCVRFLDDHYVIICKVSRLTKHVISSL